MSYALFLSLIRFASLVIRVFSVRFFLFFPSNFGSSTSSVAEAHTRNGCAWLWSTRWYFGNVLQRWYNHNKALKMQTDIVLMPIGWWKILNVLPLRSNRIAILVRSHMCVSPAIYATYRIVHIWIYGWKKPDYSTRCMVDRGMCGCVCEWVYADGGYDAPDKHSFGNSKPFCLTQSVSAMSIL